MKIGHHNMGGGNNRMGSVLRLGQDFMEMPLTFVGPEGEVLVPEGPAFTKGPFDEASVRAYLDENIVPLLNAAGSQEEVAMVISSARYALTRETLTAEEEALLDSILSEYGFHAEKALVEGVMMKPLAPSPGWAFVKKAVLVVAIGGALYYGIGWMLGEPAF